MTKDNGILVLGLIVAVTPFLGIPGEWKTILYVSAGILIAFLIFLIKRDGEMSEDIDIRSNGRKADSGIVTPVSTILHERNATEEK